MMQSVNGILYDTISHFWIMIWQKYDALMMHDYSDIDYAQMLLFVFIFLFTGKSLPLARKRDVRENNFYGFI